MALATFLVWSGLVSGLRLKDWKRIIGEACLFGDCNFFSMVDLQTSDYPYLLPRRYRVAPCIGAAMGVLLFWFIGSSLLASPGLNDSNLELKVFSGILVAELILAAVTVITGICMLLIASSDLIFTIIKALQRRGFCSRLTVARRYVFGVSMGSYLGLSMLWINCMSRTGIQLDWPNLSDSLFDTVAYQTLYSKAQWLAAQLYLVQHVFGLEDLCRGICIGVLCILIWDIARSTARNCYFKVPMSSYRFRYLGKREEQNRIA